MAADGIQVHGERLLNSLVGVEGPDADGQGSSAGCPARNLARGTNTVICQIAEEGDRYAI